MRKPIIIFSFILFGLELASPAGALGSDIGRSVATSTTSSTERMTHPAGPKCATQVRNPFGGRDERTNWHVAL